MSAQYATDPEPGHSVRLVCNECGAERQGKPGETWAHLRGALRKVGWTCYANVDRCPSCRY